jgi:hypothetical protein
LHESVIVKSIIVIIAIDEHYTSLKRFILLAIAAANQLLFVIPQIG